jgi:prepilin-type N-terminal cleavage/methylation domain-containing protein
MNRQDRMDEWKRRRGFTLIELLVVILIILLVSAVTLPTVIPAITHRQVSEAARILQGALVGARDTAINNNAPAGIRLLVDPVFNGINPSTGQLDATRILACNRFIPIQLAPDYSEGFVKRYGRGVFDAAFALAMGTTVDPAFYFRYPVSKGGGFYPVPSTHDPNVRLLCLAQVCYDPTTGLLNPPTSWYWNIRIGDKIQINNSGNLYTVVGPMQVGPDGGNSELFVNVGPPGTPPPFQEPAPAPVNFCYPEVLFLVNGLDDNNDGYVDNGFDGVDNDGDLVPDRAPDYVAGLLYEWLETEQWHSALRGAVPQEMPYIITRRPVVVPGARETALPSSVVVDLTTWNAGYFTALARNAGVSAPFAYVSERSRLPVDATNGSVDILLNPNGTVVPTTVYSSPTSFGMDSSFYHFWLAERTDLFDPAMKAPAGVPYLLPMVAGSPPLGGTPYPNVNDTLGTRALKGERRLMTLFTRTGAINTNQVETFDGTNPSLPFLLPQQGVRGDTR